ncbi:hypothetical protein CJP74_06430 [Psittacicella melopsittaci]|uniref:Uncharacterized protein n=1 Tax=Psittacicella melopsittaci TaxID=2028576 RepID=A0A3A1Y6K7_9GAMM|nr:hypothetical protein [Psittacicella melopsittaci]RIY31747.1 hypothetical protein CJP74_06430 [Psittacicella melopsittaci]
MLEDKTLSKSLTQLNEKLEAKLKEQEQLVNDLKLQVDQYKQELVNLEQNYKDELEKINQQNHNWKLSEEENKNLQKQVNDITAHLEALAEENEKAKDHLEQLSYGLGTQQEYLNKALEVGDIAKAKGYVVSFEVQDPSKSLLGQYKPYYENLQARVKSVQNLEALVKREENILKQEKAKFNAQKQQYTLALELQDYLVREKVLNHNENPDTAIAKLRDVIVPKRGFLPRFPLWSLGFFFGAFILVIFTILFDSVKHYYLDGEDRERVNVEASKFVTFPSSFPLTLDATSSTKLSYLEIAKKQTSELTIAAVNDVSNRRGFENLNPTQLNSDIQDLVKQIKEFADKASVRVVVKVESQTNTSLTNVYVLVDNKHITFTNFTDLYNRAVALQQEVYKYNSLQTPNNSRSNRINLQNYTMTFNGIQNKYKELSSVFNQLISVFNQLKP